MKIALTGGTGFIGRYIIRNLLANSHHLKCWHRSSASLDDLASLTDVTWLKGDLASCDTVEDLVSDCDAVVHNAFWRPGQRFQGEEGDIVEFVQTNVIGTLKLIEASIRANVKKFVFVSTCAVHEKILDDRKLDEAHPLWPRTHYGAHKAAIEKFVHSYGMGHGFDICAIRPTGVYGRHHLAEKSKWFDLVRSVVQGQTVNCTRGGKEVHASDVAESIHRLLNSDQTQGECFSCYDRYISQYEVAEIAKRISNSNSLITGEVTRPMNEIDNSKICGLGMTFGGTDLLESTIEELVRAVD